MRLCSFGEKGLERSGIMTQDQKYIIDINKANSNLSYSMLDLISNNSLSEIKAILNNKNELIETNNVRIGAPIPTPGLIIAVGLNYKEHAAEGGREYPKKPLLFSKSPRSVCGANDDIVYPKNVEQLDYEVELGVVISKTAKNVKKEEAFDYIFGYMTFHDVSARCAQFSDGQFFRGKSFDTFAPMGPMIVTQDELKDPSNLNLWSKVNGEIRQNSNTLNLLFDIPYLIEYITTGMTLMPGDVIATGTPEGVGIFSNPPKLLQKGDVVKMEVEGLGKIINKIV